MNFNDYTYTKSVMEVNGLKCTLHMPKAVKREFSSNGAELVAGLPPGGARAAFVVDEFDATPTSWMHGDGKASSYFIPIKAEHGMWLDFNSNQQHTHDIAVVVSVQGVNPLTGRPVDPVRLEQYREKCPEHEVEFQQDLFCPECKFKWHPQNYIAGDATPAGYFWIDGFRSEDGEVRQWVFTEEECKGVAAQIIGEKRVFAIGIAFYISKEAKPKPTISFHRTSHQPLLSGPIFSAGYITSDGLGVSDSTIAAHAIYTTTNFPLEDVVGVQSAFCSTSGYEPLGDIANTQRLGSFEAEPGLGPIEAEPELGSIEAGVTGEQLQMNIEETQVKLEIGAGAKINQQIYRDPQNLDYWKDEPEGMIYINYCDEATAEKIIKAGKREEKPEGFLNNLQLS